MAESESIQKSSLARNAGYFCSMGILLLLLGMVISTQTRRHLEAQENRVNDTRQLNQLVLLLKETQTKKSDLEKQLSNLRQQMHKLDKDDLPPSLSSPEFQKIYQLAGLTPIKGAGITLRLDDSKNFEAASQDNDGLVHSDDLLKIVNELKSAGATAMAVNNQRLVTTSEIVTAGNILMVNQTRLMPPYVIKAIGPADTMISALKMRGGIVEYLEVFGIKVNIESIPDVNVPPYTGSLS